MSDVFGLDADGKKTQDEYATQHGIPFDQAHTDFWHAYMVPASIGGAFFIAIVIAVLLRTGLSSNRWAPAIRGVGEFVFVNLFALVIILFGASAMFVALYAVRAMHLDDDFNRVAVVAGGVLSIIWTYYFARWWHGLVERLVR